MLEDPSYASIVRWGDEGDSFVVLEVSGPPRGDRRSASAWANAKDLGSLVREIHQDHLTEAFQAQQFCQFRAPAQQI